MMVTLTVTDINGLTNSCTFMVNKVDNTPPSIICPATQTLALGANCSAILPNYASLATTSDNCNVQGVTQSPAAGTVVSSAGDMMVTLTVTDINGLINSCTFMVNTVDNTPPSIICPATQTLALGANCSAILPNYASLATTSDNCNVQSVTQSPAAGTVVSSAGDMTVTLTITDVNGLMNSCTFTVTKADQIPPTISNCPNNQNVLRNASCIAILPNYAGFPVTGDNCSGGVTVSQIPAPGTVINSTITVTLTAMDANGNTAMCSFTATPVDQTPPTIACPAMQTLALGANCTTTLPNYTMLATPGDNCGVQSVTQSPATGTIVSGTGNMTVTLTVTDVNGLTNSCTFTVTKMDNTAPTVACGNSTINFNGQPNILLNSNTFVTASDNCGVQSVILSPTNISSDKVGQTVQVLVTVTDINGNTTICTSNITVTGLPAGWSAEPNGIGCNNGNSVSYNSNTQIFTVTSTNCYYPNSFTSDALAFAQYDLCGNGSITAQVTSITPLGLGWAGVTMRESNAAGAKKAQLMTNLGAFSRREFRTTTVAAAYPQQFPSQNRYWLRITRTGNQFAMYISQNGTSWFPSRISKYKYEQLY